MNFIVFCLEYVMGWYILEVYGFGFIRYIVLVYSDDIIVFLEIVDVYIGRIEEVFLRLRGVNLKLKKE